MTLETSVYTAFHGYSWSRIPSGLSLQTLNRLYRFVSVARGDFPNPLSVEIGLVSDGVIVAAFTIQNVEKWDSEQRASDYAAFAFFPISQAANVDFIDLVNRDFFWTPSRTPLTTIEYAGAPSVPIPPTILAQLQQHQNCLLQAPRAIGTILTVVGAKSPRWVCLMNAENNLKVECDCWSDAIRGAHV